MAPENLHTLQSSCCCPLSAANFFKDLPWLNVPEHRRGEILIEPLYPRGRLLGGTSKQDGAPKSKLAALAAARKAKDNQKNSVGSNTNSSVALLDKLTGKPKSSDPISESKSPNQARNAELRPEPRQHMVHPERRVESDQESQSRPTNLGVETSFKRLDQPALETVQEGVEILPAAVPSLFARTMLNDNKSPHQPSSYTSSQFPIYGSELVTKINFLAPSPDDVVLQAQSAKGAASKPIKQAQQPDQKKFSIDDVTRAVKDVKVEETKVKGKNLDVVAELEKSRPKNAANFVVIG